MLCYSCIYGVGNLLQECYIVCVPAVYMEQQEWDKCVQICEEAVEKGRELRTDYKLIAKYVCAGGRGSVLIWPLNPKLDLKLQATLRFINLTRLFIIV